MRSFVSLKREKSHLAQNIRQDCCNLQVAMITRASIHTIINFPTTGVENHFRIVEYLLTLANDAS